MTKDKILSKKICVVALGCDKNTVDSERILYNLKQFGWQTTTNPQDAQIIIVNTCAFIEPARLESIQTIKKMLKYKSQNAEKIIVVGCLPAKANFDMQSALPGVDLCLGTHSYEQIVQGICNLYNYKITPCDFSKPSPCARIVSTPRHYAYLKIADGCDNKCSYCTIPQIRGRYESVPMPQLIQEANELAKQGTKELILVAQDVTRYGEDLYKKHCIVQLIQELSKIAGIQWIRLHYCYPEFFSEALINEMANNKKVCKYIDIPIQHIDDKILKNMNRASTYKRVTTLLKTLRQNIPQVAVRTSIIVGFPGETNKEFEELQDFLKEYKLDNVGFFAYSREYDTKAYDMENQVSEKVKQQRLNKLVKLQAKIQCEQNKKFIGKTIKCVCDDETKDY
ncbi:MAG: 30S ribosomal protein S12 methylthiotransferase RimO, partial [Clostridia bacterium]|nr:30S ribosomal protein S12 methylthiotransferase RimO [Clostridia bacterium]